MQRDHRILVVEDEALGRRAIERAATARKWPIELVMAEDSPVADDLLEDRVPFAGFLFDVFIPSGDGLELLRRTRRRASYARTPALVMTASPTLDMINVAYDLGASLLVKPWAVGQLDAFVRKALEPPTPWADDDVPPHEVTMEHAVARLRALLSLRPDAPTRYRIGALVAEVKADTGRYGSGGVATLAASAGEDVPTLYRHAAVAARWSHDEFSALLARRGPKGRGLTWSHFAILSSVDEAGRRAALLERALDEELSVRALSLLIEQGEGLPPADPRPRGLGS